MAAVLAIRLTLLMMQLSAASGQAQSFEANHRLGEFYIREKKLESAIPYLERANAIDPANYNNSYDLALAYFETGKLDQSRSVIEGMLARQDKAELHNLMGDVEAAASHIEAAARQYEIAARADPTEKNLFDLGTFLASHGGYDQARTVFEYGSGRFPKSAQMQVGLGVANYSLGRYDPAVEALCRAVDLDPKDTRALDFLGKMQDIAPAYAAEVTRRLKRFAQIYPQNAHANYYYALSLRGRALGAPGDLKDAEAYLGKAAKLATRWADPHFQLALLYEDQGEITKAIHEYQAAAAIDPASAKTHYRLAGLYRRTGQTALAEREMRDFERLKANKGE